MKLNVTFLFKILLLLLLLILLYYMIIFNIYIYISNISFNKNILLFIIKSIRTLYNMIYPKLKMSQHKRKLLKEINT